MPYQHCSAGCARGCRAESMFPLSTRRKAFRSSLTASISCQNQQKAKSAAARGGRLGDTGERVPTLCRLEVSSNEHVSILHVENNASPEASMSCHVCEWDSVSIIYPANRDCRHLKRAGAVIRTSKLASAMQSHCRNNPSQNAIRHSYK